MKTSQAFFNRSSSRGGLLRSTVTSKWNCRCRRLERNGINAEGSLEKEAGEMGEAEGEGMSLFSGMRGHGVKEEVLDFEVLLERTSRSMRRLIS